MRRRPLPAELVGIPFATREARQRGVSDRRLGADDLIRPYHGVARTVIELASVLERCAAYEPRLLDGQVFSHTTALALWGMPIPRRLGDALHLAVEFPRTPPRAAGAVGHSLRIVHPALRHGMPLSSPEAAWCEAAMLLGREELVAVGDALVTGPRRAGIRMPGVTDIERLTAAVDRRRRLPGGDRARWALRRIRMGVDSPRETELRLLLTRHRLPEPAVDHPIALPQRLYHADLGYVAERIALEYEGDVHRTDRVTWMRDVRRREAMEDAGWRVVRVVAADLDDPAPLVQRLRRLLRERRPRPASP